MKQQDYAGFWIRLAAMIIDSFIVYGCVFLIFSLLIYIIEPAIKPFSAKLAPYGFLGLLLILLLRLAAFSVIVLYDIIMIKNFNWTLGKRILGLKVIGEDKEAISWGQSVIRAIMYKISLIPLGLGVLWIAFDEKKQGWHDKAARTFVIKSR